MADVFDVLAKDHIEVKRMLAELEHGPTEVTGATDDQLLLRKKMAEQLVIEESKHEALEEMYFWPAVREHVTGGDALADAAIAQEQEGKEVLNELDKADASDAEFERLLATFIRAGREHIQFEEEMVWPRAREALTAELATEIGTQIAEGKETAPTRPHPRTPASPGVLKTAGPAAAVADKARDAATGRGD
ncbi:MAG TPA: hemerythrin domain-containing protein [Trebonia sp.]|jgi:hemerythrin-like domain-containing protein|nr:hemerythrin domain-containing protein [Trebonia sp.]